MLFYKRLIVPFEIIEAASTVIVLINSEGMSRTRVVSMRYEASVLVTKLYVAR